jgi:hypothetical protein
MKLTSQWNGEEQGKVQIQSCVEYNKDDQWLRFHADDTHSIWSEV